MSTWYKTGGWREEIEAVEVEKETELSIWVKGQGRSQKISQYGRFFRSLEAAVQYMQDSYNDKLIHLRNQVNEYEGRLLTLKEQYPQECDATADAQRTEP